ncbi:B-cell receptor CD22-like isoform X2 [Dicentrarchus labrax]|uniref:B-cell receptor CD22-like isoform X2 n=1 Tax=Dicentrarchus labrax TaxID=13489 RepID=UPI0021F62244|nr:B-cell receptor CD22-like isoform X2 [Dicentrarchus labrax]
MAVWDRKILWGFVLLLAGAGAQSVNYPHPVCAVKGSTVTLLCSFTPVKSVIRENGREVPIVIVRVVWCQNHEICQGTTPSVYDSESTNNDRRYKYLGDKKGNCTLQITDIQKSDEATFRFRMEANDTRGHFTDKSGVKVTVTDPVRMKITSSSADGEMRGGESVTLYCTAVCTIHQLEVTWFKDNHVLSESGPALQLSPLTAKDSGNYTCGLKTNNRTVSLPYSLHVEAEDPVRMRINSSSADGEMRGGESVTLYCTAVNIHQLEVTWFKDNHALSESGPALQLGPLTAKDSGNYTCGLRTNNRTVSLPYSLHVEDEGGNMSLIVGVAFGVLLALIALIVVLCIIKRRRAADKGHRAVGGETEQKHPDNISSNRKPAELWAPSATSPSTSNSRNRPGTVQTDSVVVQQSFNVQV